MQCVICKSIDTSFAGTAKVTSYIENYAYRVYKHISYIHGRLHLCYVKELTPALSVAGGLNA